VAKLSAAGNPRYGAWAFQPYNFVVDLSLQVWLWEILAKNEILRSDLGCFFGGDNRVGNVTQMSR
jgi:hypothetical protein